MSIDHELTMFWTHDFYSLSDMNPIAIYNNIIKIKNSFKAVKALLQQLPFLNTTYCIVGKFGEFTLFKHLAN